MSDDKEKKSLFEKAIDLVSSRDEKEAAEEAAKKAAEAEKKVEQLAAQEAARERLAKVKQENLDQAKEAAEKKAAEAEAKLKALEAKAREEKAKEVREAAAKQREKLEALRKEAEAKKKWKKHVVKSDETLSHISLKYYGSAVKDKWMIIYEANKDVIGDNPNIIRPGMELVIPELD